MLVGLCLVGGFAASLYAQPCECIDCPRPLPPMSNFEVCYTVAGLSNPTLGANGQGVCGVSINFSHDYIENLTITLVSPAGQTLRLVGPGQVDPGTIATSGSRWNIDFVPCNVAPTPWPGTGPRFSGNNTIWGILGLYTGSYHPNAGCLSNFNTGDANGQWCLRIVSNAITANTRTLRDFQVTFCDESGPGCCEAEAPVFAAVGQPRDTIVCAGDAALSRTFSLTPSTNTIYEQRLVVSRGDTVQAYSTGNVDLRTARPGTYEICAFQFWTSQAASLPAVGQRKGIIQALIDRQSLCAALAPTCTTWRIVPIPLPRTVDTLLCEGQSLQIGTQTFTTPTNTQLRLRSAGGCDSLVNLRLRFRAPSFDTLRQSLCAGGFIQFGSRRITAGGNYSQNFFTRNGCDSSLTLVVTLRQPSVQRPNINLCGGDSVRIAGRWIRRDTVITQNLRTTFGCDSTIVSTVRFVSPKASISTLDSVLTCTRSSLTLNGLTAAGPAGSMLSNVWLSGAHQ